MAHENDQSGLRHYLNVLRRRRWLILQAVILVAGAAVAFSLTQEKLYEGTAQVLLRRESLADQLTNRVNLNDNPQRDDRVALTEVDLARSPVVAQRTVDRLGLKDRTSQQFLNESGASPKTNTDILLFTATDPNHDLAKRLATEYAAQFERYRGELDTSAIKQVRAGLKDRLESLDPSSPVYGQLINKDEQLRTLEALQTSNVTLVQPARTATVVQPLTVRNAIFGAVVGLLLGIGLAFVAEALDTRVRSADEVGDQLGLPLLVRLSAPPARMVQENQVAMLESPYGPASESFRMLSTNLAFATLDHPTRKVLVTSALQGEGKSTTVANLAVVLARSGRQVIAVDLDLRRPYLRRFFDPHGEHPGVTQVALGRARLDDALIDVPIPGAEDSASDLVSGRLQVLTSGPIPPDPGEFMAADALVHILDELAARADVVLIDTPPILQVSDAAVLSGKVDAMLIVARLEMIRRPILKEMRRLLDSVPTRQLGFVLTNADAERDYRYGYGYGYRSGDDDYTPSGGAGVNGSGRGREASGTTGTATFAEARDSEPPKKPGRARRLFGRTPSVGPS